MPVNSENKAGIDNIGVKTTTALYLQDSFMHAVLNTVDALVLVLDHQDRIILFNSACERVSGYRFGEVEGKDFTEIFLLPEEKELVKAFGAESIAKLQAGQTARFRNYWVAKDGSKLLIDWSNTALATPDGENCLIVSVGIDVTEQEQAKRDLEYSEQLLRSLFENARDAIFLAPLTKGVFGNYIEVNQTAIKLLGYTREEFMQMTPDTIPVPEGSVRHMFKGKEIVTFEQDLLTKDGKVIPFEHKAIKFKMGEEIFCLAVARDVRERRKIELELRRSEERYRYLVEMSPKPIFVHVNSRIVYANEACARLLRARSARWLAGRYVEEFIHPDCLELVIRGRTRINPDSPVLPIIEIKINCFDGTVIEVEAIGSMFLYDGEPAIQVIYRDITGKKRREEEVLRDNKLSSIGSLAGSIAHEYNNILTVILGNLTLAKYYAADWPEIKSILTEAEEASRQAQELTQHLLTFARGGQPVKRSLDMRKLLIRCGNLIMRQENANCNLSVPGDLCTVEADESQIYHAITNIVSNALQAMPDGGTVHITAKNVPNKEARLAADHNDPCIRVDIRDEGIGIAAENLEFVFDPFFSTKPGGNGLGLSTAYSIIKKHGGSISVESQEGKGTCFSLYLPAENTVYTKEEKNNSDRDRTGRILFMDDEESVRKTTKEMLSYLGYEVVAVCRGEEALQCYIDAYNSSQPFKFVILDLKIVGGMGGKETIQKLLDFDPQVCAVVSSGYFNDPVMADHKHYGFSRCLPKPFTMDQLDQCLKDLKYHA